MAVALTQVDRLAATAAELLALEEFQFWGLPPANEFLGGRYQRHGLHCASPAEVKRHTDCAILSVGPNRHVVISNPTLAYGRHYGHRLRAIGAPKGLKSTLSYSR